MNGMLGGVYLAIVEGNKLDERGRIGITIPHSDRAGSYSAQIASFMAGNGRGALFLPEKKDQVLVAFVNGVADAPVIIGSLWSRTDKPPEANSDGENDVKLIRTRGGNEIRITDKNGEETIEITAKKEVTIKAQKIVLDGIVEVVGTTGSKTTINGNQITGS
jgi:uncharacterized protein involved in type VI secretion and phage assembly